VGGCSDLDEFRTDPNEAYQGDVIGTEGEGECDTEGACSFIRRGFPEGTVMTMRFRPRQVSSQPGTLSTDDDQCGEPTFDETPLKPIAPLAHDQLSLYDFPGDGRVRNYIFIAQPEQGPLAGRDATVFVSLIRGGSVEVRVIAGPGRPCAADACEAFSAGRCDFFGVFSLGKEKMEAGS
jgi:hypothetical protein